MLHGERGIDFSVLRFGEEFGDGYVRKCGGESMKGFRPKKETVDPRLVMPRGANDFEERRIKADFLAVFKVIANAGMNSIQDTHEYAYRAGFVAGKPKAETIRASKLPTYIDIL